LTLASRQEIFATLVSTQDVGLMTVAESVRHVSKRYEITRPTE
jgi:hypothetical protein